MEDNAKRKTQSREKTQSLHKLTQRDTEPLRATLGQSEWRKKGRRVSKVSKNSRGKYKVFSFSFSIKLFLLKAIVAED